MPTQIWMLERCALQDCLPTVTEDLRSFLRNPDPAGIGDEAGKVGVSGCDIKHKLCPLQVRE